MRQDNRKMNGKKIKYQFQLIHLRMPNHFNMSTSVINKIFKIPSRDQCHDWRSLFKRQNITNPNLINNIALMMSLLIILHYCKSSRKKDFSLFNETLNYNKEIFLKRIYITIWMFPKHPWTGHKHDNGVWMVFSKF